MMIDPEKLKYIHCLSEALLNEMLMQPEYMYWQDGCELPDKLLPAWSASTLCLEKLIDDLQKVIDEENTE